jgi:hypothetical protein
MKMYQLYTAYYSDRRAAYEKPLEWIYAHQGNTNVEIRPTIWLWGKAGAYFVDYVGDGVGCTLETFPLLKDAEEYRERISQMDESEFEDWLINVRWKQAQ